MWFFIRRLRCLLFRLFLIWLLVIIINCGLWVVNSNRIFFFILFNEDDVCVSIVLLFCLRLVLLLMLGKIIINGVIFVCWWKSLVLCVIFLVFGIVLVMFVKSVFIIGINGLLAVVRGRSISKLSSIMNFFMGGIFVFCVIF